MVKIYLPMSGPDFKHFHVISPPIKWDEKELNENNKKRRKIKNLFIK